MSCSAILLFIYLFRGNRESKLILGKFNLVPLTRRVALDPVPACPSLCFETLQRTSENSWRTAAAHYVPLPSRGRASLPYHSSALYHSCGAVPAQASRGFAFDFSGAGTGAAIGLEDDYIFDYSAVIMLRVVFCVSCQEALTVRQFS